MATAYLLPIADREPLAWILREGRTALPEGRAREAMQLQPGDLLFLYTTRGCFRNPTRDRGRVIGRALVRSPARRAEPPPAFAGRAYPFVVELSIDRLAPRGEGLELVPLVPALARTFPDPAAWSVRMRRALVPLDPGDAAFLEGKLRPLVLAYEEARTTYLGGR